MKTIKEFIYESNKFSQLKQWDVVAVVCKNYNRETVSIQKTTIKKISSSEIQVNISSGGDLLTFDKEDGSIRCIDMNSSHYDEYVKDNPVGVLMNRDEYKERFSELFKLQFTQTKEEQEKSNGEKKENWFNRNRWICWFARRGYE